MEKNEIKKIKIGRPTIYFVSSVLLVKYHTVQYNKFFSRLKGLVIKSYPEYFMFSCRLWQVTLDFRYNILVDILSSIEQLIKKMDYNGSIKVTLK